MRHDPTFRKPFTLTVRKWEDKLWHFRKPTDDRSVSAEKTVTAAIKRARLDQDDELEIHLNQDEAEGLILLW